MIKNILIVATLLAFGFSSQAQTTPETVSELNSTPPAQATVATPENKATAPDAPKISAPRKLSYGLSAGTQFSRLFGTATYLEPSVMFPVTKRFSAYASLNMVTSFGANYFTNGSEAFPGYYASQRNQRFILNAGGNYMVTDRLNLTGSVWRDLSKNQLPSAVNLLMPGGTNGMSLRANYKVTENLSVSGGLRFSNGNGYHNNIGYYPGSSFGY